MYKLDTDINVCVQKYLENNPDKGYSSNLKSALKSVFEEDRNREITERVCNLHNTLHDGDCIFENQVLDNIPIKEISFVISLLLKRIETLENKISSLETTVQHLEERN